MRRKILKSLSPSKASVPDELHHRFLKEIATKLSPVFPISFSISLKRVKLQKAISHLGCWQESGVWCSNQSMHLDASDKEKDKRLSKGLLGLSQAIIITKLGVWQAVGSYCYTKDWKVQPIPFDNIFPPSWRCRNRHSPAFQIPTARTNIYKGSFFPQTIRNSNTLPDFYFLSWRSGGLCS